MLQEIKYRLFEIFLTQKKKLVLFACLIFVGLFVVSQTTHAFALDLANVQLDALDFIDNSVLKYLVFIALLAIESVTLLNISAGLLDWSSRLPVTLSGNDLVYAGWQFTSGLANIIFILIFVAIALAYIFKLETFGMKKALPKLIIMAFLINFSLLFVKMFTDIGWIVQNSFSSVFFKEGTGLATAAASALTESTMNLLPIIVGVPVAYMAVAWIPYVNVAALTAIGALVLATGGGALLGVISQTIMVIVFNFIVGFIFLSFAALFLVRIAFIWILAILAPLAFMAFILPATKKHFDNWLKTLAQWILLGVVVFFLMGLGLMLFGLVAPGSGQTIHISGKTGNWEFFDTFYKYIFLVIYMIVIFAFSKKLAPIGSQMITGGVSGLVMRSQKFVAGKISRPLGIRAEAQRQKLGAKMMANIPSPQEFILKQKFRAEPSLGEKKKLARKLMGWKEKRMAMKDMYEAQELVTRGALIQDQENELRKKTKGMDEQTEKAWLSAEAIKHSTLPQKLRDKAKSAALVTLLFEKDAQKENHRVLYEEAWKAAGPPEVKNNPVKKGASLRAPHWMEDKEIEEGKPKWNTGTIQKWSSDAKENEGIVKKIVETLRGDLITALGSSSGKASEKVQIEIDKTIGEDWRRLISGATDITKKSLEEQKTLLKELELIRYLHHSAAGEVATWKKYGSIDKADRKNNVNNYIKKLSNLIEQKQANAQKINP